MPRILVISEHPRSTTMAGSGFFFRTKADFESAFSELQNLTFDALVIDVGERDETIDFIKRIRSTPRLRHLPILVTAEWGTGYGSQALSAGADAYEPTPCNAADLLASVKRLLPAQRAVAK